MIKKTFNPFAKFGIQLWSVKDEMAFNPNSTIKKLASFGYTQIETFEGANGMSWGMKPHEFKKFLTDLELELIAGHCDIFNDIEKKIEDAIDMGLKFLVCPWLGPQASLEDYKKAVDVFNKCGEQCFNAGIGFAYHNHDYSFKQIEGIVPQQLFLERTNPAWVSFEMDIYWVDIANEDASDWLSKYPGRWPLVHLKDKADLITDEKFISIELGKGTIDYKNMLKHCLRNDVKYFMVEQERFESTNPMEAAKANAAYMLAL